MMAGEALVQRGGAGMGSYLILKNKKPIEISMDLSMVKRGQWDYERVFEERWPGFTKGFIDAAREDGWKDLKDKNANFGDGFFPVAVAHNDGRRTSTATAYLLGMLVPAEI